MNKNNKVINIIKSLVNQHEYLTRIITCLMNKRKRNITNNESLRVIFLVRYPWTWNSFKSVYEQAIKCNINATVICVPEIKDKNVHNNDSKDFLDKIGIPNYDAYQNDKWLDIKTFNPDYVFYTYPYNSLYPESYRTNIISKYSKICYIPYGMCLLENFVFHTVYNVDFMAECYLTFAPSNSEYLMLKNKYALQDFLHISKFIYLGYARYDLIYNKMDSKKIIAWLPRWSFDDIKDQKKSHFLQYFDKFIELMEELKEYTLIIRPHPKMFSSILENKILTENELNDIIDKVDSMQNVFFDKEEDYMYLFNNADFLIADFTSLLAEYFVSGKPIIYCDDNSNFTDDAMKLYEGFYCCNNWKDLNLYINNLINGNDYKKEIRNIIKLDFFSNQHLCGKRIVEFLKTDSTKRG